MDYTKETKRLCLELQISPDAYLKGDVVAAFCLFSYIRDHEKALYQINKLIKEKKGFSEAVDKKTVLQLCRYMRSSYKKHDPVAASLKINAPLAQKFSAGHIVMLQRMWSSAPSRILESLARTMHDEPEALAA